MLIHLPIQPLTPTLHVARTPEEGQRKNQDEVWDLERESKNYILMYRNLLSPHELMYLDFCYKTEPLTPLLIIFGSYLQ